MIEFLRKQIGVSYEKAREALSRANNDIIEAIIMLKGSKAVITEQWQIIGPDLQARLKALLREAHYIRITVQRGGKRLFVVPMWLGIASVALFPVITLITTLTLLYNDVSLTVERLRETG